MIYIKDWIDQEWFSDHYQQHKRENFELLDQYLDQPPLAILDIGCGLAWESRWFNEKYGSSLWLIDGDSASQSVTDDHSQARYHATAETFMFYLPLATLNQHLQQLNTKNYRLYTAETFDLPEHFKFDLITSWVSCGFHYPVSTYRDILLRHCGPRTRIVMDLRTTAAPESGVTVVNTINRRRKYHTCEIAIS